MDVLKIENNYSWFQTKDEELRTTLWKALRFRARGYYHNVAYKMKVWDGYTDFFKKETGRFLTGLLPEVKFALKHLGADYQVDDKRGEFNFLYDEIDENFLNCPSYNNPVVLRDYQVDYINQVIKNKRGIIPSPTGCHRKGQQVLMYDGSIKKVEDIVVGDVLMGPDSNFRQVLELCRGVGEMYEVIPTKGESFVVNKDHILSLRVTGTEKIGKTYNGNIIRGGSVVDVSLSDWINWSKTAKHSYKLFRIGVDFKYKDLPIDPYFLGVILGDGSTRGSINITTIDNEIVREVEEQAKKNNLTMKIIDSNGTRTPSYYLFSSSWHYNSIKQRRQRYNPFTEKLRLLGLFKKTSKDKFIPFCYKTASIEQRRMLLAGLLDTDGHLHGSCYDFISKSELLASDVCYVARSLGLAAYMRPCKKYCQTGNGGVYYRVSISGECSNIPCKINRKKSAERKQKKNVLNTGFSVKKLGVEDYYGFVLDGDGRYLLGDFTVTHNSGKTNCLAGILKALPPNTPTLVLANKKQLVEQNYDEIRRWNIPNVGRFYGEKKEPDIITCSTVQSAHLLERLLPKIKVLIVDEIHEMMSKGPRQIYAKLKNACVRVGMSATAFKFGGSDKTQKYEVKGWIGPMFQARVEGGKITTKDLQERNILTSADCAFYEVDQPELPYDVYLDAVTRGIAENEYFHNMIVKMISKLEGRSLIIVERIEHGDRLQEMIPGALWVRGEDTMETRKEIVNRLKTEQGKITAIATSGIFNTGINVFIHNLINAAGGQADHQIIQRFGRGLRVADDKSHLKYYDFVFTINEYLEKHSRKRIKVLQGEGHDVKLYKAGDLDTL